ncbi:ClpP class serine protease [Arcicella aurantiaca]|uniref:ClpP class serine protease n=1 Tax=Arcicella aurantiaca TaxID=591202 RepID=A0A316E9L6_9BACT|nr:S49 family peptidase [Arcicella aurantiaca]PWK27190.1 ClpP class serine protease [Arcicella aurantiaca]
MAWHIHQASAIGLMPLVMQLMNGELQASAEPPAFVEGISHEAQRNLDMYAALKAEPYVSDRDTYYYDHFPMKMGEVLMIPIIGAITQEDYCGTAGTNTIMGWYDKAKHDSSVKVIIETKNSPGGAVFGTRGLAEKKLEVKPPIIGHNTGMEASACLYIGATDDYKFASNVDCMTGSCGVMTTFQDWSKWYEENGVKIIDLYSKTSPLKNDSYRRAMNGDFKGYTDGILFKFDESFMSFVKQYRPNVSQEALKGADFLGADAIASGLIDEIGSFEKVYEFAMSAIDNPQIITQKKQPTMEKKTVKMSAFMAGLATFFGAEIENDIDNANGSGEGEGEDNGNDDGETPETVAPEAKTPQTPQATVETQPQAEDKDAIIAQLRGENSKLKAAVKNPKASSPKREEPEKSALSNNDVDWMKAAGLTFPDED